MKIFLFFLASCASTPYVSRAPIWLHDSIPSAMCDKPEMFQYGIYRRVSCSENASSTECKSDPKAKDYDEFIPYCDPMIKTYLAIKSDKVPQAVGQ